MRTLIVKFSSIGDCIMAVPVPSAIRRGSPEATIVWAIDPRCAAPVATTPVWDHLGSATRLVDQRFEIPWEKWKAEKTSPVLQMRHYLKLRPYRFDLALDLQGHAKTAICLKLSGAKKRFGIRAKDPLAAKLNSQIVLEAVHHVEGNLEALRVAFPGAGDGSAILPDWAKPRTEPHLATISVSTGHPKKNYAHWGDVARRLLSEGWTVEFLGGPTDHAPSVEGAVSRVGALGLRESLERVSNSHVHLAADTGTGHWAAAVGVPVVSLFGAHTDPQVFGPYTERRSLLRGSESPSEISPDQVMEAVRAWR